MSPLLVLPPTGWLLLYPSRCHRYVDTKHIHFIFFLPPLMNLLDKWGRLAGCVDPTTIVTTIFAGHQIVFFFFIFCFLQTPTLYHRNQISSDDRGDFLQLFIKTVTSAIMVTPLTMKEKKKKKPAHFTILLWWLWFSGNFVSLVSSTVPLTVLSIRFAHLT